jgi:hypothetical protein
VTWNTTLCGFNEIHHLHATYCMIKMIKTTNNEMFKEFVLLIFCGISLDIHGKKL